MADEYMDFDLRIWNDGDVYNAEVRSSPAGTTDKVPLNFQFLRVESAEGWVERLEEAILEGGGDHAGPGSSQEKFLRDFGSLVFHSVFDNAQIANCFRSSMNIVRAKSDFAGLRLRFGLESPELALLPWEYLFDESIVDAGAPQTYLCLHDVSPLVRFVRMNGPVKSSRIDGPLRILGMISNPNIPGRKHLDIGAERLGLEAAIRKSEPRVKFEWLTGGTVEHLYDAMQDGGWHVFHFIGHGGTETVMEDGVAHSRGFVFMEDGHCKPHKISAEDLGMALEGNGDLRLAILNCCDSGRGSSFASPGAHLVRGGVPLVVAMQFAISNGSASAFARRFYRALVSGHSVERAITSARREVRFRSRLEWGIPVLFTRNETSVCFDVDVDEDEPEVAPVPAGRSTRNVQARAELRELLLGTGRAA